jgi:hypothetical protein
LLRAAWAPAPVLLQSTIGDALELTCALAQIKTSGRMIACMCEPRAREDFPSDVLLTSMLRLKMPCS